MKNPKATTELALARMTQSVARLMKLDDHHLAHAIASAANNDLTELRSVLRVAQQRLLKNDRDENQSYEFLNDGNAILALAFTRSSLLLLQRLSYCDSIIVNVLKTDVAERYFKNYLTYYGRINLLLQPEMATPKVDNCTRSIFVTFPDHSVGMANTNLATTMFGESFLFQMTESWLSRKHEASMFIFDGESIGKYEASRIEICDMSASVMDEIQWIAAGVERAIKRAPNEYYAWYEITRKLSSNIERRCRAYSDVLKGILHAWIIDAPQHAVEIFDILESIDLEAKVLIDNIAKPTISSVGWRTT